MVRQPHRNDHPHDRGMGGSPMRLGNQMPIRDVYVAPRHYEERPPLRHCEERGVRRSNLVLRSARPSHAKPGAAGYIMIETAVAMVVLALGAFAVNGAIQQAIQTRGQAQDFTRARFLLDSVTNELLLQPILTEGSDRGTFDGQDSRFSWAWSVSRVNPPVPSVPFKPLPPNAEPSAPFQYPRESAYLAHVHVTIRWDRAGMPFEESYETLLAPERLWQPPPPPQVPPQ